MPIRCPIQPNSVSARAVRLKAQEKKKDKLSTNDKETGSKEWNYLNVAVFGFI